VVQAVDTGSITAGAVQSRRALRRTGTRWVLLFVVPAVALYALLVLLPILVTAFNSFFLWDGTTRREFAGLGNYQTVLDGDRGTAFLPALRNNTVFFLLTLVVEVLPALLLAGLLNNIRRGRRLFQTLYALPFLISPIVVGYIWLLLLDSNFGPVSSFMRAVGWDSLAQPWLAQPSTALPTAVVASAWMSIGAPVLIFGAALGSVPDEILEAAKLDGAGAWRRFVSVQLSYLRPAITIIIVLDFIGCFKVLDLVYALGGGSNGGPAGALDTIGLLFYRTAFVEVDNAVGKSGAVAVLMFLLIFGGALIVQRLLRRWEREA